MCAGRMTALVSPMRRHHELPFGAELVADGARFRLWAPGAQSVMLLLDSLRESPHPNPPPQAGEGDYRDSQQPSPASSITLPRLRGRAGWGQNGGGDGADPSQ